MITNQINGELPFLPLARSNSNTNNSNSSNKVEGKGSFADTISEFITDVDGLWKESGELNDKFLKGEPVDIHNVMIAMEKSKTAFQLLSEIRNKFLDMYKEVSRMQV